MSQLNADSASFGSSITIPTFATGNYPTGSLGQMIMDSTTGLLLVHNGDDWVPPGFGKKAQATGGNLSYIQSGYQYHLFWTTGQLSVSAGGLAEALSLIHI